MSASDERGLSILVGDSGGAGGLSTATVLDQLMKRIQFKEGLSETPLVEEYSDVVSGAGTGAITMTLVGRLGMTTEQAMETFARLSNEAFSERFIGKPTFRASKLEKALKEVVRDTTGNEDELMLDRDVSSKKCKTMVFTMSRYNMNSGIPTILRSYRTSANPGPNCTIWQALRAATTHPEMFKSITIVNAGIAEPFMDAAMGCGNPIEHVLAEVKRIYPNRCIACIVSIGSGHPNTIHIPEPSPFQRILPTNVIVAMRDVATDNERMAQSMATRFRSASNVYFRLNVDQGMRNVRLGDWDRLTEVKAHTRAYMEKVETKQLIERAVTGVREKKGLIPVEQIGTHWSNFLFLQPVEQADGFWLDGEIQVVLARQQSGLKECPVPTPIYVERRKPLQQAIECLTNTSPGRRVFAFHGFGGAGKTQLALQTVEQTRKHWSEVVYVDATSVENLESTLRAFAIARGIGTTHENTLRWLSSYMDPWLLVFDNAGESSLGLQSYLPKGTRERVLITMRARNVVSLARGPNSDYNVSGMEPEESLLLLLTVARPDLATLSSKDINVANSLTQENHG
ncbi:hypothetical protein FRC07_009685 [Ceratobasidium sp. 392]|nr:hypothetical protein FRC07_009685 [Ceratobasidium sp. 392]